MAETDLGRQAYDAVVAGGGKPIDGVMATASVLGLDPVAAMNALFAAGLDLVPYQSTADRAKGRVTNKLEWVR